jgi:hypothetical protein
MSEPRPIAWIGFPEDQPTPKYDVIYDGTTQLPGYIYKPIWHPKDHPSSQRARKGAELQ